MLDQIAQLSSKASAKYGASFVCSESNSFASEMRSTNSDFGMTVSISQRRTKDVMNSDSLIPQNLHILSFSKKISSNPYSGMISFTPLKCSTLKKSLVNDSGLNTENNIISVNDKFHSYHPIPSCNILFVFLNEFFKSFVCELALF